MEAVMESIEEHFVEFSDVYVNVMILIQTIITALLLIYWLKPFVVRKRAAYASAVVYLLYFIPNIFIDTSSIIWRIVLWVVMAVTIFALWSLDEKRNLIQKIYLVVVFRLIWFLAVEIFSELGFFERDIVFNFDLFRSNVTAIVLEFIIWNIIFYGGSMLLLYGAIRVLHKTYKTKSEDFTWQEFIMLFVPSCSFLAVKPIISSYMNLWMDGIRNGSIQENIPGDIYRVIFDVLALVSIIILIVFYEKNKERQEEIYSRDALMKQMENAHIYVNRVEEMNENIKAIRHDVGNHMTVIAGLVEKGNIDELSDYIKRWQSNYKNVQSGIKTGNPVTDIVISDYASLFEKAYIDYECSYKFFEGISVNPFDMSVVLFNALNNAYDATRFTDCKNIKITSVLKDKVYIISVQNTEANIVKTNEEGIPYTTKEDAGHGYGIKNIQTIARKYKGDIEIRQEVKDDKLWFVLNIMMIIE